MAEEFANVPEKWKSRLSNLAVLVEDEPSAADRKDNRLQANQTLLGLYRGVPATKRGGYYGVGGTLPDTITLYRLPILEEAGTDESSIRGLIRDTLWHEIAHHFGFDEGAVGEREENGTNKYK